MCFREDIGALEEIRSELETSILAPVKHPGKRQNSIVVIVTVQGNYNKINIFQK